MSLFSPLLVGFDLARHSVPTDQILDGGPPKDGIPAILQPKFVAASDAVFLAPNDQVVGVVINGKAKAYPLKILNWHEVVDDSVGGSPVAVTYCPLTGSSIVYNRALGSQPVTLGVSGKLYESNLLFYDKGTESLWSQIKGEAIAGPLTGRRLEALASVVTVWDVWRKAHPDTLVLDVNTGYTRNYGTDPYGSYAKSDEVMFPVSPTDDRLPAKERILGVTIDGADGAFPLSRLARTKLPLNVDLGGRQITVIFDPPTQTAGAIMDGKHIPAYDGYWFAWAAFHPKTTVWQDADSGEAPGPTSTRDAPRSGVYGFSGTADGRGVVGECIWIYDALNRVQTASGNCSNAKPGQFRIPLVPGQYVVRGPGGNHAVKIKENRWTRVDSVLRGLPGFGPLNP